MSSRRTVPPEERIWRWINKDGPVPDRRTDLGPCWLWTGGLTSGYGQFAWSTGNPKLAHRVLWEMLIGEIPPGLHLDHLCMVRACVNPAHLEPVTPVENLHRAVAERTHCVSGRHRWIPENLFFRRTGSPTCRLCMDLYNAKKREARRLAGARPRNRQPVPRWTPLGETVDR